MAYNKYGNNNGYNKGGYQKQNGYQQQGNTGNTGNTGNQKAKLGAIWKKFTKNGEEYLSIQFNGKNYVAFVNRFKQNPNQPDFNIMESQSYQQGNKTQEVNGYKQNGYQAQKVQEQTMDDYYAAQNQQIETIPDIPSIPGMNDDIVVF